MKPIRLTLSGFKGIEDGLGLPSFTLDLGERPGLIALKGRNGRGKSTLIDNLHPYRLMPSRMEGSAYSPKSASFYDCICNEGAAKDLLWEHEQRQFRSLISWKNSGRTRSCTAYLFEICDGVERPYALADGVLVDGKTDVYDRAVEEILGPPEIFFTSAFSAQGKQPISAMQPGDAKRWLGNLLNQAPIRALGERAKAVAKALAQALQPVRAAASELPELQRSLDESRRSVESLRGREAAARSAVALAEDALIGARAAQQAQETSEAGRAAQIQERRQREQAVTEAGTREAQGRAAIARVDAAATTAAQRAADLEGALRRSHATTRSELERPLATATQLLQRAEAIRQGMTKRATLLEQIQCREERDLPALRQLVEADAQKRQAKHTAEISLAELRGRFKTIQQVGVRAKLASRVPCAGSEFNAKCELLCDARQAQQEHPDAEQALQVLEAEGKATVALIDGLTAAIRELNEPSTLLRSAEALQRQDRDALRALDAVAADALALESAEQQRADANQRLAAWEPTARAELQALIDAEALRRASVATNRAELEAQLAVLADQTKTAREALQALPTFDPAEGLRAAQRVQDCERALQRARADLGELERQTAGTLAAASSLDAQVAIAIRKRDQAAQIESEIAVWTLLSEALSDKGIIALEIDAAGPSIASEANRLLTDCYDARFSVELKTQVATGKGEVREGFDILVHDSRSNDTRSMSALSGGQRVWVNEAIIRSVAVYLAQAGQRRYQTLFTDEVDGALDPERKHAYMQMKLALLRMGLFDREIFITQTPELLQYADRVIDLDELAATP